MSLSHILDATPPSAICGQGMTSFPAFPSCSVLGTPNLGLASEWAPWTHQPDCHYSQLCLYTHAGACGRGISIITTSPSAAEDILQSLPANCSRSSPDTSSSPYFEVRPAGPGKGMGAFATRKIPRGTKLFDEAPAVLRLETAGQYADPGGAVSGSMMERAVAQLRRPERVLELSQHDGFVGSRAQNAAAFNSFTVKYGAEDAYAGIFPDISVRFLPSPPLPRLVALLATCLAGSDRFRHLTETQPCVCPKVSKQAADVNLGDRTILKILTPTKQRREVGGHRRANPERLGRA